MRFLTLDRLTKTYPDGTKAVCGIDLSIEEGEFVVLLGPSGCGKTTTLRMVAGLETPTSGRIVLDGRVVTDLSPSERDVGFVFQFYALYPHMSVAENIAFPLSCAGVPEPARTQRVHEVARRLGLDDMLARRPRELSGGDQQRVGLARAVVRRPKIWLMDEPLGTLDADRRAQMCAFLRQAQLEGHITTIYVTHDQDEALRLADRIVVMSAGEVVQVGTPDEVYDEPATLFVARFVGSPGMNLVEGELRDGTFRAHELALAVARSEAVGPCVLGFRPERMRLDRSGPVRGRVVLDAFAGACRYTHVDTPWGRVVARTAANERARAGEELALAIDPAGIRLFDQKSGGRIA